MDYKDKNYGLVGYLLGNGRKKLRIENWGFNYREVDFFWKQILRESNINSSLAKLARGEHG